MICNGCFFRWKNGIPNSSFAEGTLNAGKISCRSSKDPLERDGCPSAASAGFYRNFPYSGNCCTTARSG